MTRPAFVAIRHALLAWFDRHRRDLPWRRTADPWSILVSEVMLQQTRVETVIPFYLRFVERFPTPDQLAQADEPEVLALWAGLGYYRRARNLQAAARQIRDRHGGRFPDDFAAILALPGVGRYTAGAVASIGLGQRAPLVDGNVARVLSRLFALDADLTSSRGAAVLWDAAADLLDQARPGDFNQALMELGALVCIPAEPRCLMCPLQPCCEALVTGALERFPPPRERERPIAVRLAAALLLGEDGVAAVRRAPGTRMAGLLDFPALEIAADAEPIASVTAWLTHDLGRRISGARLLGTLRHAITRHRIRIDVVTAQDHGRGARAPRIADAVAEHPDHHLAPIADHDGLMFMPAAQFARHGASGIARKILRLLSTDPPR